MPGDELTGEGPQDMDRVEFATILGQALTLPVGAAGALGLIPESYVTYAAGVFAVCFTVMLGKMAFFDSKENQDPEDGSKDQVMADATAVFMFTGCQAIIIGFFLDKAVLGFVAWFVLIAAGTIFAAVFDGGYTPMQNGEEFTENLRAELKKAAESDEYTVPDDPEEVLEQR